MLESMHRIHIADSADLGFLADGSVGLVVTSPPYPMIGMWDDFFKDRIPEVGEALGSSDGKSAFEYMHRDLDRVWSEVYRVLLDGGFACINIGDATRKVGDRFRLYSNHSRVLATCSKLGFDVLPLILWRKQTNAPNKFMGSGMLPAGAYVTLEHEYILVLRKGGKREFRSSDEKQNRQESAFFWEERNTWFSDIWDFKGIRQSLQKGEVRARSAAFPFELAYRLVCMYSVRSDIVLDPFLGTGTTMFAAMATGRSSVGVELDPAFLPLIHSGLSAFAGMVNGYVAERVGRHLAFCERCDQEGSKKLKHTNTNHRFPVMTAQETNLRLDAVGEIAAQDDATFSVAYVPIEAKSTPPRLVGSQISTHQEQLTLAF